MNEAGLYTEKVIKHFQNPHNYGRIKDPDGVGKVGNILCGDVMYIYIRVGKRKGEGDKEIIKDIKFETLGCAAAISTSSVVTDLVKGRTLEEALKIDSNEVVRSLGGLPPIKRHCSLLAVDALGEAIYDYLSKSKREIPRELRERHRRIMESGRVER